MYTTVRIAPDFEDHRKARYYRYRYYPTRLGAIATPTGKGRKARPCYLRMSGTYRNISRTDAAEWLAQFAECNQ